MRVASAAGMARLAPNGLLRQTDSVDVGCLKPGLVKMLRQMKDTFGRKVVVTSGYRSPSYNRRVDGADARSTCTAPRRTLRSPASPSGRSPTTCSELRPRRSGHLLPHQIRAVSISAPSATGTGAAVAERPEKSRRFPVPAGTGTKRGKRTVSPVCARPSSSGPGRRPSRRKRGSIPLGVPDLFNGFSVAAGPALQAFGKYAGIAAPVGGARRHGVR